MIPLSYLIPVFFNCPVLNTYHPLESLHDKRVWGDAGDMAQQVKAFVECLCSIPGMHNVKDNHLLTTRWGTSGQTEVSQHFVWDMESWG